MGRDDSGTCGAVSEIPLISLYGVASAVGFATGRVEGHWLTKSGDLGLKSETRDCLEHNELDNCSLLSCRIDR